MPRTSANEPRMLTIATGNIFDIDHVNSIVAAGRADLCARARPHLANPAWMLTAAAEQRFAQQWWPEPYLSGRAQLERNIERAAQAMDPGRPWTPSEKPR